MLAVVGSIALRASDKLHLNHKMRIFSAVILCYVAVCSADDLAQTAGQIFNSILPNLIGNSVTGQQGSTSNTLSQIGTVVGGVVDYSKKKSYEDLLRQIQDSTTDEDLLRISQEMFASDTNNAFNYIQINLQGKTNPGSKNDEAPSQ